METGQAERVEGQVEQAEEEQEEQVEEGQEEQEEQGGPEERELQLVQVVISARDSQCHH